MSKIFNKLALLLVFGLMTKVAIGQTTGGNPVQESTTGAIVTAVPFLTIAPDARASGMGDVGVATTPDANSAHWNPSKYAFIDNDYGFAFSYNPWLSKIVNDMYLAYVSGYFRLNDRQTLAASMKYFDLGDIQFTDDIGNPVRFFNPREFSFDVTFAMKLSERFSMGVSGRYIYSNLSGATTSSGQNFDTGPGSTGAIDISAYWQGPEFNLGSYRSNLALGANISNFGFKMDYQTGANNSENFLPTNLRLGTTWTTEFDPYNKLALSLDFNKLLVPSDPTAASEDSFVSGVFSSFSDSPDGFSGELQEIMISTGLEYWYNDIFAARAGYFYENPNKGDRQYVTLGLGVRYQVFEVDFSYLITTKRNNPLEDTLRIGMKFNFGDSKSGAKKKRGRDNSSPLDNEI
ncbi:type IX secretion system outer membrane channel protein PorV [Sediminitomix flava]|uniref:Type IX secretion system protein PorV domain-containing protein n=1 Tax=Sediminitomix flava TaxID=379075 RepID=A0A315Z6N7_SEDFL|nr:type IX secretion system outer membrane channel protein PorV [Sediminitomix flava]PWJ39372.1 hypothetical protein BC781_106273 [Sediminitomix flava]